MRLSFGSFRVYNERLPPEPPYPSISPSLADFTAIVDAEHGGMGDSEDDGQHHGSLDAEILHAPPG